MPANRTLYEPNGQDCKGRAVRLVAISTDEYRSGLLPMEDDGARCRTCRPAIVKVSTHDRSAKRCIYFEQDAPRAANLECRFVSGSISAVGLVPAHGEVLTVGPLQGPARLRGAVDNRRPNVDPVCEIGKRDIRSAPRCSSP